ncbi:MAG: DUF624 domain-containing protein [Lachnospiraceae bacterium]|nr:DUF624 domain-containing protein [Lachnospiraceae bacterium]
MKNLFHIDGPAMQFMLSLRDLAVLNFLFLICCVPVITIGPSFTALFTVTFRMAENKEGYVGREFLHAFKENIKKPIAAELLLIIPILILSFNLFFWSSLKSVLGTIISVFCILFLLILAGMLCYVFPLIAKFENTVKQTLRNAFYFATEYKGYTLALIALVFAQGLVLILTVATTTLMLVFGFAFFSYIDATILLKLLKRFYQEQAQPE